MSEEISAKSFFYCCGWWVQPSWHGERALWNIYPRLLLSLHRSALVPIDHFILQLLNFELYTPLLCCQLWASSPAKNKLNAPQFPKVHIIICFIETLQELQMSLRFRVCGLGGYPLPLFVERFYSGFRKNGFDTLLRGKWKRFHQQFSFNGDLWSEHGVPNQRRLL